MADVRPLLSHLPTWVQAVSVVGFPVIVASFLLLKEVGYFPSTAEANAAGIRTMVNQHSDVYAQIQELVRLSREICRNTAKTVERITECFPP